MKRVRLLLGAQHKMSITDSLGLGKLTTSSPQRTSTQNHPPKGHHYPTRKSTTPHRHPPKKIHHPTQIDTSTPGRRISGSSSPGSMHRAPLSRISSRSCGPSRWAKGSASLRPTETQPRRGKAPEAPSRIYVDSCLYIHQKKRKISNNNIYIYMHTNVPIYIYIYIYV